MRGLTTTAIAEVNEFDAGDFELGDRVRCREDSELTSLRGSIGRVVRIDHGDILPVVVYFHSLPLPQYDESGEAWLGVPCHAGELDKVNP